AKRGGHASGSRPGPRRSRPARGSRPTGTSGRTRTMTRPGTRGRKRGLEKLRPQDFRIRTDDPRLKDFGADVNLVGPGPAYDRWKKTAGYQQWLKETGQASYIPGR